MQREQRIVVNWLRQTMASKQLTAEAWANLASISPTTITRSMHESYDGVTSLKMLDRLAKAAGVTSPLEALDPSKIVISLDGLENVQLRICPSCNSKRSQDAGTY